MIKFRVYDNRTKQILERPIIVFQDDVISVSSNENSVIDDYVLMQSTGLTDKNGKEIFEGDVLEVSYDDIHGEACVCDVVAKSPFDYSLTEAKWLNHAYQIEIIGNIHEHPHLLEKENEGL
ncbi:YopX family protein [Macrococcoides bohemicum]|uniref:YopX family protein n=1 Tax=Macrococcoides bohemicum TaxID=1903056 RepID=A0AAJ4PAT4_9STAP|nr:YopX family protein [Macrococcus bohemicus]QYA42076.1 YopX family protein [Macrococcus bohemicus]